MIYKSPYPYFGGKSSVAPIIWQRLGNTPNYVEPFLGSAAVLLARPQSHYDAALAQWPLETVNDRDGMISNFWRALQADPEKTAHYADCPVNENDLHARHWWLVNRLPTLTPQLEGDPDFYDAKAAGWWVWGMACWIGTGFCGSSGPWVVNEDKLFVRGDSGQGIKRQLPHLGNSGRGIKRKTLSGVLEYFQVLSERLRRVRVASGDWTRVMGRVQTFNNGLTSIVLDPPYRQKGRDIVYNHDHADIADDVMQWALVNGDNPLLRIVYCGYADGEMEHQFADAGWDDVAWKTNGGYALAGNGNGKENRSKERLWFSPNCIQPEAQMTLFSLERML